MRLLRNTKTSIKFHLTASERTLLKHILGLYPVVPPAHQKLSKSHTRGAAAEDQHLLDVALAEQRASHTQRRDAWLAQPGRFQKAKAGCVLTLPRADIEWLLQVLNDIRIGNWLLLGAPEERLEPDDLDPKLHRIWAAMELSGMFQLAVLHAMEHSTPE